MPGFTGLAFRSDVQHKFLHNCIQRTCRYSRQINGGRFALNSCCSVHAFPLIHYNVNLVRVSLPLIRQHTLLMTLKFSQVRSDGNREA